MIFSDLLVSHWRDLKSASLGGEKATTINGRNLSLGAVVAVARYTDPKIKLDPAACSVVPASADVVAASLARGLVIYGVNTGFGGNADTRVTPSGVEALQRCLTRGKHCGILDPPSGQAGSGSCKQVDGNGGKSKQVTAAAIPLDLPEAATTMPESWVRAAMFIRLNSLISGSSGVKLDTVECLAELLNRDVIPRMPLRGSISASGDLSPLSYIAGVMQGKSTLTVQAGERALGRKCMRADRALADAGIKPIVLGPKEGLAIINGTSVSAGVATLALHESLCLAGLSQVLTAMSVEAFLGTDESFDPFIAQVRPHPGQVDSSSLILAFLRDSQLVAHNDGSHGTLRQDRYSLRTASQWVGPVLEDFQLAYQQLNTEVNSVTDNPLVDREGGRILHGGNFQAKAVTSAVEKLRQGLQSLGRMLFSQVMELLNPATNRGLPPNLVVDEPSQSYLFKGLDMLVASLASELGFLSNPVGSHVMTAELGNQGINSLALISARYTMTAVECMSQLTAAHLVLVCQALDLRAMHATFVKAFGSGSFSNLFDDSFAALLPAESERNELKTLCLAHFLRHVDKHRVVDSKSLFDDAAESLVPCLLKALMPTRTGVTAGCGGAGGVLEAVQGFVLDCAVSARLCFQAARFQYRRSPDATPLLGKAAGRMYTYVRRDLGVRFIGEDEVTTPPAELMDGYETEWPGTVLPEMPPSVGSYLTTVYQAIRSGELYDQVVTCFEEAGAEGEVASGPAATWTGSNELVTNGVSH